MTQWTAFVSCTKAKRAVPCAARDLYISPLFRGLREYAESSADRWFILSAKYGILGPEEIVEPYDRTLNKMSKAERLAWWSDVKRDLIRIVPERSQVMLLAGSRYRENIEPFLRRLNCEVEIPLEGLTLGRQLAWLKAAHDAHSR